ncbi:hypothetical protein D3C77_496380 [compost metagenome]
MALLKCLFFRQADRADRRLTEHRRRNVLVVHRTILLRFEQAPRHRHAFGQGHRRQLHPTDHVANGEDRRFSGLVQLIDANEAARVKLNPGVFQAQIVEHRPPAGSVEHTVGDQLSTILEGGFEATVVLALDALDIAVELQVHAALFQLFLKVRAHRAVKAAQEQFATV